MKLKQNQTPLYTALKKYADEGTVSFHVPGHKQGRGNLELFNLVGLACVIDVTCMEDQDNICNPVGPIKDAQILAAQLYGADNAFFLVNGTTCGIQAMIMGVCEPGDKIIIPRNAHKSVISSIIMSGAVPVYVEPEINSYLGIAMGVRPEYIEKALQSHPDAKAVFMINPTYYGVVSDLKAIVDIAHAHNIPVLVDEAHGAHLKFCPKLPLSAMEAGADLAASSTHKLAGSLTQSSLLLHQGSLINPQKIKAALNLTQTTSPSYILMASIDIARKQLAEKGVQMIQNTYDLALQAREKLKTVEGIFLLDEEVLGPGCYAVDPTKIVINTKQLGFSGYEMEKILRKKYHIQVELSDLFNVLAIVALGDNEDTLNTLVYAVTDIANGRALKNVFKYFTPFPSLPESVMSPREAFYGEKRTVLLSEAKGEVSAEMIMAYPPGIPIICPGERITQEVLDYIHTLRSEDAVLQGTEDPELNYIKVLTQRLFVVQPQNELLEKLC